MARPLREGGGKGPGHSGKNSFFWNLFFQHSNVPTAIKLEEVVELGLNGPAIKI